MQGGEKRVHALMGVETAAGGSGRRQAGGLPAHRSLRLAVGGSGVGGHPPGRCRVWIAQLKRATSMHLSCCCRRQEARRPRTCTPTASGWRQAPAWTHMRTRCWRARWHAAPAGWWGAVRCWRRPAWLGLACPSCSSVPMPCSTSGPLPVLPWQNYVLSVRM